MTMLNVCVNHPKALLVGNVFFYAKTPFVSKFIFDFTLFLEKPDGKIRSFIAYNWPFTKEKLCMTFQINWSSHFGGYNR